MGYRPAELAPRVAVWGPVPILKGRSTRLLRQEFGHLAWKRCLNGENHTLVDAKMRAR